MRASFPLSTATFVMIVTSLLVRPIAADVLYVHSGAIGANNGTSWTDAYRSLQDALAHAAGSGGSVTEIWVAAGAYMPDGGFTPVGGTHVPGSGDRLATFQLLNGVALYGGFWGVETSRSQRDFSAFPTVLSGDLSNNDVIVNDETQCSGIGGTWHDVLCDRIINNEENSFHVVTSLNNDETAILDGFIVSGGHANGPGAGPTPDSRDQGAGINVYYGTPMIRNCVIEHNRSDNHGALNDHGGATIENCELRHNFATRWGGALHNHEDVTTTILNSRFIENATASFAEEPLDRQGGGAALAMGSLKVSNTLFERNVAAFQGGALYGANAGTVEIADSVFRLNRASGPPPWPGGTPTGRAGAIYFQFGNLTVVSSTFESNLAMQGAGAVSVYNNALPEETRFERCQFLNNSVEYGGVGAASVNGPVDFADCVFRGNRATVPSTVWGASGGAFHLSYGPATFSGCVFDDNAISGGANGVVGGAGAVSYAEATFTSCLFTRNSASSSGGALFVFGPPVNAADPQPVRFINSVFAGNLAGGRGSALFIASQDGFLADANFQMINCTFIGNRSTGPHATINVEEHAVSTLSNSIVWGNRNDQGAGAEAQLAVGTGTGGGTLDVAYSVVQGGSSVAGTGIIDVDPMFIDPLGPDGIAGTEDDDLRLLAGSPAIDAGDNAAVPSGVFTDIDGNERIAYGTVDIGAYEFCPAQRMYGDVNDSGTVNFSDVSLVLDVFRGLQTTITFDDADVFPCGGDDNVNFSDVSAAIDAFRGTPPCPDICI